MSKLLCIIFLILLCTETFAVEYKVKAKYSLLYGLFPLNKNEHPAETIPILKPINSDKACIDKVKKSEIFALGQAMMAGATDVILKCVKYWENDNCSSLYPGCTSEADIGAPIHIHLYRPNSIVPKYLRLRSSYYEILQTVVYTKYNKSKREIVLVTQTLFEKEKFSKLLKGEFNCIKVINNNKMTYALMYGFFVLNNGVAIRINCLSVDKIGLVKNFGSKLIFK